jgi:hypothetical protein
MIIPQLMTLAFGAGLAAGLDTVGNGILWVIKAEAPK